MTINSNHYDWASKWAAYSPNKMAFKEFETGRSLTFARLNRLANRLAHQLTSKYHIQKGGRVAILAENCLEYLILFAAAQKTGCILVPINYRLASEELTYLLSNSNPTLLLYDTIFQAKLEESGILNTIPFHCTMNVLAASLDKDTQHPDDDYFECATIKEDDPIFILYTSGTTGFPKGSLYTHQMLFWNSVNTALSLLVNSESRTVNCMPPFHTGGWNVLTTPFFHHGGYTCLMKNFEAEVVLRAIEAEQVTIFMGVPTMLKMIADLPAFEKVELTALKYMIVGGEPMPVSLIEKWQEKGVPIRQGFGMTEVGPNLTSLHQDDAIRKIGSIGRPNFYVQTKIVDQFGLECKANEAGELLLRGPMVTPGYWQNEEATEKAFSDSWFRTGDRVLQDAEGYLFVVDRIKNMFISGGENVYPAEVERVLSAHPTVSAAAVIGVPDPKWGESGRAFIVKKQALSVEELIEFCQSKLAKFKIPKSIVFLEELPKNDTGKINKKALSQLS